LDSTISNNTKSCPSCLTANDISADFCSKCGHPIGSFVNLDPLNQVQSQGHLFREATNNPRSSIILIGLWIYFGITAFGISLVLFYSDEELPLLANILFIGLGFLSCAILYKATKNYLNKR